MKPINKYDTSGLIEAQFEPGSRNSVLINLIGITKKSEMDRIEALALQQSEDVIFNMYGASHKFKTNDICQMHKIWLGNIYPWAGNFRKVNLSKDDFDFAAASQIPYLMEKFEKDHLSILTPCDYKDFDKTLQAIAFIHVELILIHPFREGNGRIARLLSTLMALQAGFPPLDFSIIKKNKKEEYFMAVRAGLGKDYLPMESIFKEVYNHTINSIKDK